MDVLKVAGGVLAALFIISIIAGAGDLTPYLLAIPVACFLIWCVIGDYLYR